MCMVKQHDACESKGRVMTNEMLPMPLPRGDWGLALRGFLREKEARSGSKAIVVTYESILSAFFGVSGKKPVEVLPADVHTFVHAVGPSGKAPARARVDLRVSAISSFCRFLVRMGVLDKNPCDVIPRPKAEEPAPRGLTAEEIQKLLAAAIPDTPAGLRDPRIVLWLGHTGRRRNEVLPLTVGDLSPTNNALDRT